MTDTDSVSKVIIKVKNRMLLLKKPTGKYEFAGGHLNVNETFRKAAIREVFEETGIVLNKLKPIFAEKDFRLYLAQPKIMKITLSDEHIDYVWAKIDKVARLPLTDITRKNLKLAIRSVE